MKSLQFIQLLLCFLFCISCNEVFTTEPETNVEFTQDTADGRLANSVENPNTAVQVKTVVPKDVSPRALVDFAQTLIGVPYRYGSTDPAVGFDCSGFITHVFNHFDIKVPRSSVDFTHVGQEVLAAEALAGDLILFKGTDSASTIVGHMGIVTENVDSLRFIHSTSGRQYGVTVTTLNKHYLRRFVKVIRIF